MSTETRFEGNPTDKTIAELEQLAIEQGDVEAARIVMAQREWILLRTATAAALPRAKKITARRARWAEESVTVWRPILARCEEGTR